MRLSIARTRGIEGECRLTDVVQQRGVTTERRGQRRWIEFLACSGDCLFQIFTRRLRIFDFAIEQADIAIGHIDPVARTELLANIQCLQLLVHRFGKAAHIAQNGTNVHQRQCTIGGSVRSAGDAQRFLQVGIGLRQSTAASGDAPE